MQAARLALAAMLPLAVAGCGVPDIVAHGVKAYERSQEPRQAQTTQPPAAYQPPPAATVPARDPDPIVPAAVPPRETVTSEPLK